MAWVPRPGTFHYGRTESDYRNLVALHEKYRVAKPPIEELKAAALADGYPPEKVAKFRYPDLSKVNVHRLLFPHKYKPLEPEHVDESDNESDNDDDDDNKSPTEDNTFDVDEFCSDVEEEDYASDGDSD